MVEQLVQTPLSTLLYREKLDKITSVLKSLANEKRIDALILLDSQSPLDFQIIKDQLQISKTALSNHLNILEKEHLITRISRGIYAITKKGSTFLSVNASLVMDIEKNLMYYLQSNVKIQKKNNQNSFSSEMCVILDKPSTYIPSFNSLSTGIAIFQQLVQIEFPKHWISAIMGICFLNCLSIEKYELMYQYQNITKLDLLKNLEQFGIYFISYYEERSHILSSDVISLEDFNRAKNIFTLIKNELKKTKKPILIFGLDYPGYSLIVGIQEDNYIVDVLEANIPIKRKIIRFDNFIQTPFLNIVIVREYDKTIHSTPELSHEKVRSFIKNRKNINGFEKLSKIERSQKIGIIKMQETKNMDIFPVILKNAVDLASGNFQSNTDEYTGENVYNAWKILIKEVLIYEHESCIEKCKNLLNLCNYFIEMKEDAFKFLNDLAEKNKRSSKEFLLRSAANLYFKIMKNMLLIQNYLKELLTNTKIDSHCAFEEILDENTVFEHKAIKFLKDCTYLW
ncbi:MAG: winged helix-turn-helix domain-containing protein [Candidatus Lokiarchaeota archaeon]|nr:winged helix-turn-helix domain-containing protein [Candidatus Harpocratesius repetitus]